MLDAQHLVLCSGTLRRRGLVDTARVAATAGFDGISVYLREVRAEVAEGWTLAGLRGLLDDLDLDVAELDGELDWLPGGNPSKAKPSVAEAADVAAALRARSLSVIETDGRIVGVDVPLDVAASAFAAVCDAIEPHGVLAHIEYFPFSGIADLRTALAIAAMAGRSNGGVLVDTWHHTRGPDRGALPALTRAAPAVLGIQLSEAASGPAPAVGDLRRECLHGRCLPGAGAGVSAAMLRALRAGGCDAPVGIEVFSDELDACDALDVATRAVNAARQVAAAAQPRDRRA